MKVKFPLSKYLSISHFLSRYVNITFCKPLPIQCYIFIDLFSTNFKLRFAFPGVAGSASYTVVMTDYTSHAVIFTCQKLAFAHRRSATILSRTKELDKIYVDKASSYPSFSFRQKSPQKKRLKIRSQCIKAFIQFRAIKRISSDPVSMGTLPSSR